MPEMPMNMDELLTTVVKPLQGANFNVADHMEEWSDDSSDEEDGPEDDDMILCELLGSKKPITESKQ